MKIKLVVLTAACAVLSIGTTIAADHKDSDGQIRVDVKPGISDQGAASNLSSYGTAPPPKGDGQLPGKKAGDPIPGIPIGLEGDPGSIKVSSTTTDANGAFHFSKVPAGKYKLIFPDGQPARSITVGAKGSITGVASEGPDGKASITFNGQTASAPLRWTPLIPRPKEASIKMPSKVAENESPRPTSRGIGVAAGDVNGDGVDATSSARLGIDNDNRAATPRPTRSGGLTDGLFIIRHGTAPPTGNGGNAKPGLADADTTMGDVSGRLDGGAGQLPGISDQGAAGGLTSYRSAPPSKDGAGKLRGTVKPIAGTEVGLEHDPEGIKVSAKTEKGPE